MERLSHHHEHNAHHPKAHGKRRVAADLRGARANPSARAVRLHVLPTGGTRQLGRRLNAGEEADTGAEGLPHQTDRASRANAKLKRYVLSVARALGIDVKKLEVSIGPTEMTVRYGAAMKSEIKSGLQERKHVAARRSNARRVHTPESN